MPKQAVVPDDFTKPYYDACNQGKLVIQNCKSCNILQHPPAPACRECNASDMEWKEVSGRGTIYEYGVIHDCPVASLQADQPFNVAVIMLDEDQGIQMYSHLPGVPADEVPVGSKVEVIFEETPNGQKVPEWKVVN
tara:strand:- start:6221 stop:6628 length:408 start_codon:yes stop_codon:yes gene_type:complete